MVATLVVCVLTAALPSTADAHLATWGSWEITKKNLDVLFPEATKYLRKKYVYTEEEIVNIEKFLGFALYPEDKTPEFYIAVKEEAGKNKLLGVALFIDPRVKPKIVGGVVIKLEVGIGVNAKGQVERVAVYDYKGDRELTRPGFLNQLKGRTLKSDWTVGPNKAIKPVSGQDEESQLVANAAREALYLMKVALGK